MEAELPLLGARSLPKEHGAYLEARAKQEQAIEDFRNRTLTQKRRELRARAVDYMIAVKEVDEEKLSGAPEPTHGAKLNLSLPVLATGVGELEKKVIRCLRRGTDCRRMGAH